MKQEHQKYYNAIQDLVLTHLTPVLTGKLEAQENFINQIRENLSKCYSPIEHPDTKTDVLETVRKVKARKELLAKSVNEINLMAEDAGLDHEFSEYFEALHAYAETLPESLLEDQNLDRFQRFPDDNLRIKVGKTFKKWGLHLGWVPRKIANWFRVKFKKPPKSLKMWKHQVPLRGMIHYHFRDLLSEQLMEVVQTINRTIAASTHELYAVEAGLNQKFAGLIDEDNDKPGADSGLANGQNIETILAGIRELSESIPGVTVSRLERIYGIFLNNYELVGTIELPVKQFESSNLDAVHQRAVKSYNKTMKGWQNTLSVLSDRYNFDHELFHTRFTNFEQYLYFKQKLESRISNKILSDINQVSDFLESKEIQLSQASTQDQDFKKALNEIRFETSRFLKQAIPACIQTIREQNIPWLAENLEIKTRDQIAQLSETRSLVENLSYEHAIKESEIDKIAPKDLITFEALPEYLKEIQSIKKEITTVVDSSQQHLMEISNICDFNLETALAAIDDVTQHDKAKSMSIEGFNRARSRLGDIVEDFQELAPKAEAKIHQGVDNFNKEIMALNEIDRVFDTQVRIAKAMAVERAKALRRQYIDKFREFLPRLLTKVKRQGLMVYKRYRDTKQRYGISSTYRMLTAEVAGFLSETENTVKKLPFVYQRLFEITPLDNIYFYEPRTLTNLALRKSYENWESGHYGATSLVAEAGSGATTLTRFFLQELNPGIPVHWLTPKKQIYKEEDLFQFFSEPFKEDDISTTDGLVDYLNQLEGRRIIVLEDLERFFLRKVNGFDCIKLIIEVLARTNDNIFWLLTIDLQTYQYLVKTNGIDDCFSYNVTLNPLKPEQVTSLVLKRHRVSGFSVIFKPNKLDRKNSRFKKMTEEEQQAYLQNEYLSALNQLVKGNASLALIYWLRSIVDIQEDVMYMRSLKGLDTTFLTQLSEDKLFTLHAMLLHHGITIEDHSRVFNQSLKQSQLMILTLFDDGLITKSKGMYYINPLVFSQVVGLLKDKNIIH